MVTFLSENKLFNPSQHGFMKGRSCLSALLSVYDELIQNLSSNQSSCIDMPQGTVLRPLLYLVQLSDISTDINHSSVVSFADDTRVYRQINDSNDCDYLQCDLDNVYTWATTNNMVFNDGKCQHTSYHHQSKHRSENHIYPSPSLNIINSQQHIRDLGVTMSSDCSFYEHIDLKIKQCCQLTGWILRTFKARDKSTMLTLFKSLVLPRLEYGCQLWCPATVNQIRAMESIQRKFTKHIDDLYSLSYKERLIGLHMYSLQRRRERYAAIYVWKILEDMVPNLSPPIAENLSDRRGRMCAECGHIGSLAYNSFRWRGSRICNALPPVVRNMSKCGVKL